MNSGSLPVLSGNPGELYRQYRQAGGDVSNFALYAGAIGGMHNLIYAQQEGARVAIVHQPVKGIPKGMLERIESTAIIVTRIIEKV